MNDIIQWSSIILCAICCPLCIGMAIYKCIRKQKDMEEYEEMKKLNEMRRLGARKSLGIDDASMASHNKRQL